MSDQLKPGMSYNDLKKANQDDLANLKVKWPDHIPTKHDAAPIDYDAEKTGPFSDEKCGNCGKPLPIKGNGSNWHQSCWDKVMGKR